MARSAAAGSQSPIDRTGAGALRRVQDNGPDAVTRLHHAGQLQGVKGFPDRTPADAKHLHQLPLRGRFLSGLQNRCNPLLQMAGYLFVSFLPADPGFACSDQRSDL